MFHSGKFVRNLSAVAALGHIHHQNVQTQKFKLSQSLSGVGFHRYDLHLTLRFQELSERGGDHGVVIHEHDFQTIHPPIPAGLFIRKVKFTCPDSSARPESIIPQEESPFGRSADTSWIELARQRLAIF